MKKSIPLTSYRKAFQKAMNCKKEEFLLKRLDKKGCCIALYNDTTYMVDQYNDIWNRIEDCFDPNCSDVAYMYIFPGIWWMVAEEVHTEPGFKEMLYNQDYVSAEIRKKHDENWCSYLQGMAENVIGKAYAAYSVIPKEKPEDYNAIFEFWSALDDDNVVYGKAIEIAGKIYDKQALIQEYVELLIEYGQDYLVEFQGGEFRSVDLLEDDPDGFYFYIYEVEGSEDDFQEAKTHTVSN